ncbi:hypothetical protein [Haladaptatus sp. CMAA 1911]
MGNDHVSKPNVTAFDDMHLVWKLFWAGLGVLLLLFWGAILLAVL